MGSLHTSLSVPHGLQRLGLAVSGWAWSGVALAHPGHDHSSWWADWVHLFSGLTPLLALLAVGVGTSLWLAIEGRGGDARP